MTREADIDYLSRRAEEEREKAEHASDPASYRVTPSSPGTTNENC